MLKVRRFSPVLFSALLLLLVLACARAAPIATPTKAAVTAAPTVTPVTSPTVAAKVPSGVLNVAVANIGSEKWEVAAVSGDERPVTRQVAETLLNLSPSNRELVPELAERWELSPDGLTWTFTLRKGVRFHKEQGELSSADVKFTFDRLIRPGEVINPRAPAMRSWTGGDVNRVETPDSYTIVVKSPGFVAGIDTTITSGHLTWIQSKRYFEAVGDDAASRTFVGTGPFEFVEHKRGYSVALRAVRDHWRKTPEFQDLNILIMQEPATRLAAVRSGSVDLTTLPLSLKNEASATKVRLIKGEIPVSSFVVFGGLHSTTRATYNPATPWVGSNYLDERPKKIRYALNMAIDTSAIINKILLGEGAPMAGPLAGYTEGTVKFDPAWRQVPYDPAQARKLLAEAGWPSGFVATAWLFSTVYAPSNADTTETVASFFEDVGIKVKRVPIEFRPTMYRALLDRDTSGVFYVWSNPFTDSPLDYLRSTFSMTGSANHFEHEILDAMREKAQAEIDPAKRLKLTMEIGQWLKYNYLTIPVAHVNAIWATSSTVGDWPMIFGDGNVLHRAEYITHRK